MKSSEPPPTSLSRINTAAYTTLQRLPVSTTFIKFLVVGGAGYLVNQFVLFTLYDLSFPSILPEKGKSFDCGLFTISDLKLLLASIVAVEASIVSNFTWHQRWTFRGRHQRRALPVRFLAFHFTSMGSPLISLVAVNVLTPAFVILPYIANTIGICLAAAWNWTLNSFLIWPKERIIPGAFR